MSRQLSFVSQPRHSVPLQRGLGGTVVGIGGVAYLLVLCHRSCLKEDGQHSCWRSLSAKYVTNVHYQGGESSRTVSRVLRWHCVCSRQQSSSRGSLLVGEAQPGEGHTTSAHHDLPVDVVAVALHQALRHVAAVGEEVAHRGNSKTWIDTA